MRPPDILEESLLDHDMSHSVAQLEVFPTDLQMRRKRCPSPTFLLNL